MGLVEGKKKKDTMKHKDKGKNKSSYKFSIV